MARKPRTRVKSERHAELGRRSIADRPRDARGRLLPPPPKDDPAAAPPAGITEPEPEPEPTPDPPRARRRMPWDRRA